jgi:hypothetical protein
MTNLLNIMNKASLTGVPDAGPLGPSTYEPSIPRVALGIAGVAMTVITIAVSVILPAQMDSMSREPRVLVASTATPPASSGLVTVTRITVVAARESGSSTVSVRTGESVPRPGPLAETTSPAIVRVSSAAR